MKKFQNIRKRVGLQELRIPKILLTNEEDGIIIMENLKTKGFQLLDRVHNEGNYVFPFLYKNIFDKSLKYLINSEEPGLFGQVNT